jgi:hypothetical protein
MATARLLGVLVLFAAAVLPVRARAGTATPAYEYMVFAHCEYRMDPGVDIGQTQCDTPLTPPLTDPGPDGTWQFSPLACAQIYLARFPQGIAPTPLGWSCPDSPAPLPDPK